MTEDAKTGRSQDDDVAFIQSLADLLKRSELSEISVKREYGEKDRLTVSLSRHPRAAAQPAVAPPPPPSAAPAASAGPSTPTATPGATDDPANVPGAVTSPMVGTAYLGAEPGSQPFVTIGQQVAEGDTLLIVEAMKTMNHIPAPRAGTVRRILIEDGSPVEFGAPLMVLD